MQLVRGERCSARRAQISNPGTASTIGNSLTTPPCLASRYLYRRLLTLLSPSIGDNAFAAEQLKVSALVAVRLALAAYKDRIQPPH